MLEEESLDTDVVKSREGGPLQRDVETQRFIYRFPDRGPMQPKLRLDVEKVKTYYTPVRWDYH